MLLKDRTDSTLAFRVGNGAVVRTRSLVVAKNYLWLGAAAASVCAEEEVEDYKKKRMKTDGEHGMIHQQEPSGPRWSVDPEVTSAIHITFSFCFTPGLKIITMGVSSTEKCSERAAISHTELNHCLKQKGWKSDATGTLPIFKLIFFCIVRLMSDPGNPDQPGATPGEFQDLPESEKVTLHNHLL